MSLSTAAMTWLCPKSWIVGLGAVASSLTRQASLYWLVAHAESMTSHPARATGRAKFGLEDGVNFTMRPYEYRGRLPAESVWSINCG